MNELHSQGYVSIGCEPCTRPVLPNQHEREGRWWWEDSAGKECGLHSGNIKAIGEQVGDSPEETLLDLWPEEDVKVHIFYTFLTLHLTGAQQRRSP